MRATADAIWTQPVIKQGEPTLDMSGTAIKSVSILKRKFDVAKSPSLA